MASRTPQSINTKKAHLYDAKMASERANRESSMQFHWDRLPRHNYAESWYVQYQNGASTSKYAEDPVRVLLRGLGRLDRARFQVWSNPDYVAEVRCLSVPHPILISQGESGFTLTCGKYRQTVSCVGTAIQVVRDLERVVPMLPGLV